MKVRRPCWPAVTQTVPAARRRSAVGRMSRVSPRRSSTVSTRPRIVVAAQRLRSEVTSHGQPSLLVDPASTDHAAVTERASTLHSVDAEEPSPVCRAVETTLKVVHSGKYIAELRSVTCHIESHSASCHPTQVNAPRLNLSLTDRYSIYA